MSSSGRLDSLSEKDRIAIVRRHFENKGYRVHSGLQFGCELVLYADDPDRVHSDFCVHVVGPDERLDWRMMQTLVRSMPDLHKTLILANLVEHQKEEISSSNESASSGDDEVNKYEVQELAIATEHAPFRHKNTIKRVGEQVKKQKTSNENS